MFRTVHWRGMFGILSVLDLHELSENTDFIPPGAAALVSTCYFKDNKLLSGKILNLNLYVDGGLVNSGISIL